MNSKTVNIEQDNDLMDFYFNKLSDIFEKSNLEQPVQHFASLVLFDRLLNFHFENNPFLRDVSNKYHFPLVYTSSRPAHDYLILLKGLNEIEALKNSLHGIIKLMDEEKPQRLTQVYSDAFNVCREVKNHKFNPEVFGRKFNAVLRDRFINNRFQLEYSSPEIIGKLIANFLSLKSGDVVFDPAIGIGTFFVEFAHQLKIFDFKVVGMDINRGTVSLCKINFLLNGIYDFEIKDGDSLTEDNLPDASADLSISNPPFGISRVAAEIKYNISNSLGINPGSNFASLFIARMLKKTKPNGKIISVVDDSFLFSKQNYLFRKYLVENNYVEKVFSLPAALYFPNTSIGSNVLLLNKDNASIKGPGFYNGRDAIKFQIKNKRPFSSDFEIEQFINASKPKYSNIGKNTNNFYIPIFYCIKDVVVEHDYDLTPARYTSTVLNDIGFAKQEGEHFVRLNEILRHPPINSNKNEFGKWPYLRIRDLKKDQSFLFFSQIQHLNPPTGKEIISGRILDHRRALLISKVGSELKPTILILNEGEKVVLNNNIHFFTIDTSQINEEYLIGQLNSTIVKEQAELYRTKVVMESLNKDKFLQIEIPLPPLSQQLEWVSKNVRKEAEKNELTSFIKSIPLIESSQDIKNEIERFTKLLFNSEGVEYKRYFEYETFPFSNSEIESLIWVKKIKKDNSITLIALHNDDYGVFGAVSIEDENPIDFKKVHTINEYAAFLTKIYDFLTKSSINRQLDSFAHTSRNFFYKLQGEIGLLIDSKNDLFQHVMNTTYVETDEIINYFVNKGTKSQKDFLLKNQLISIKEQTSAQYNFYNQIHELYSEIKNAPVTHFYLKNVIDEISLQYENNLIYKPIPNILVLGKQTLLKHALLDLINNGIKYSSDKICHLDIVDKGSSFVILLSNSVEQIIMEDKYNLLGQTWLKDNSNGQDRICSGLYYAFQMIRESLGDASLIEYGNYKHNKSFKVLIQLRKYE